MVAERHGALRGGSRGLLVISSISQTDDGQLGLFGETPLGFNKRRIPHTEDTALSSYDPNEVSRNDLEKWQLASLREYERSQGYDVGVSLSLYPNGGFTAACTALGAKPQKKREKRGPLSSTDLTPLAKKTLKRAIENHWRRFDRMFSFTFDPKNEVNVLAEIGTIDHAWAHKRIYRLLAPGFQ